MNVDDLNLENLFVEYDDVSFPKCKYVDPCDIRKVTKNPSEFKYRVLHYNIRGLASHFDDFCLLLADCKEQGVEFDFILLCETFLNNINERKYAIKDYAIEPNSRVNMQKGGICLYVKSNIEYRVRGDLSLFEEGIYESLIIELINDNVIVGEIYRVPDTNPNIFIDNYNNLIDVVNGEHKNLIIGTDQNIDLLKFDYYAPCRKLLNSTFEKGVIPLQTLPTRITHTSATLIDIIYSNYCQSTSIESGIFENVFISDHCPIYGFFGKKTMCDRSEYITVPSHIKSDAYSLIRNDLLCVDWSCLQNMNCEEAYDFFIAKLQESVKCHSTKSRRIRKHKSFTGRWVTPCIITSSHKLKSLFRKSKNKEPDHPDVIQYKLYKNVFNSIKRKAKQNYYSSKFRQYYKDTKKTWTLLRHIIGKSNDVTSVGSFDINGVHVSDNQIIANSFNTFFSSIGDSVANSIPYVNKNFKSYLSGKVNRSFFMGPTDPEEINKIIGFLKPKASCGYDNISSILLKQLNVQNLMSYPLSIIFNKSIEEGVFPKSMKTAKVIPIYKSKERNILNNYRPVSLLPVVSKVLERIVYNRLYNFVVNNNVLNSNQYGFQTQRSTIDAITQLCGDIIKNMDKKEYTLAVFCDLSKAFDTVQHDILLHKLEHYGVRGITLEWFRNYPYHRKMFTSFRNSKSNDTDVVCGVPQGSILGPLLFLIYINDLTNCLTNSKSVLFADDTTMYISNKCTKLLFQEANVDVSNLRNWFHANKLSLNSNKTKYVLFRNKKMKYNDELSLTIGNEIISRETFTTFLGMRIDEFLNWDEHVTYIHKKLSSALYILRSSKNYLSYSNLRLLYYALFEPHLKYGILLWSNTSCKNVGSLFKMQKKAIRIINKARYNDPSSNLFKKSKILKLEDIVSMSHYEFMFKYTRNLVPLGIANLFSVNSDIHQYNTRQKSHPHVNKSVTALAKNSFIHKAPIIYQNLPVCIKTKPTIVSFRKQLKFKCIDSY